MRKLLKFSLVAALLAFASPSRAIDFVQTNQFVIAEQQTLQEETWLSTQDLSIEGTVAADLFAVTQTAELSGTFGEDVWCLGDTIRATGVFDNGARLASKTVLLQGAGHGPLIAVGNTVKMEREATLTRGALCVAEHVILEGTISGPVRILAQTITVGGHIEGDLTLAAQEIVVLPKTVIHGDLTYTAPEELVLPSSVQHSGDLKRAISVPTSPSLFKPNLASHVLFAVATLIAGLAFTKLFPRYVAQATLTLRHSTGLSFLIGFGALFLIPIAAFFLILTGLGSLLGLLVLSFYGMLLYLSQIIVASWISMLLFRRQHFVIQHAGRWLALGLLILYALTALRGVSFLTHCAVLIFGNGALLIALFRKPELVVNNASASQQIIA